MITITQGGDIVTLINVFTCEPAMQQELINAWIRATKETLGKLPGILSAALHRSKDGTRVVNYAQWASEGDWQNLVRLGRNAWFGKMAEYAKPDAHLYEVCYLLDKSNCNLRCRHQPILIGFSFGRGLFGVLRFETVILLFDDHDAICDQPGGNPFCGFECLYRLNPGLQPGSNLCPTNLLV